MCHLPPAAAVLLAPARPPAPGRPPAWPRRYSQSTAESDSASQRISFHHHWEEPIVTHHRGYKPLCPQVSCPAGLGAWGLESSESQRGVPGLGGAKVQGNWTGWDLGSIPRPWPLCKKPSTPVRGRVPGCILEMHLRSGLSIHGREGGANCPVRVCPAAGHASSLILRILRGLAPLLRGEQSQHREAERCLNV